jgi:NADP-dependent 3-hydroxy acid dehydrogenase YdfG
MAATASGLDGRLVWITGGATGIGRATAAWLGRAGATVAISGRRLDELERTAQALADDGLRVEIAQADVADVDAVTRAHDYLTGRHGPVSVMVCAAGTNIPNRSWARLTPDSFARVIATNVYGVSNCVQAVLPGMRAMGEGTIVVISSWAGWQYLPFAGAAYNASKSALAPLVQSLNDEEGRHGVRACHLCPGEVATTILRSRPVPPPEAELARMLRPEDVADAVGYVATAPRHVCLAEVVIAPTWNRIYIGGEDLQRRP